LIWLIKLLDKIVTKCAKALAWLAAPQRLVVFCLIVALIGAANEYGGLLPGCGGPVSPLPTPLPPASPLQTPGAGW